MATAEQLAEIRARKGYAGRKKGQTNKITKDLKKAYLGAFDALGGMEGLINWGEKNPDLFYGQISKLLPKGVEIKAEHELQINIISAIPEPLPLEECDIVDVSPEKPPISEKTAPENAQAARKKMDLYQSMGQKRSKNRKNPKRWKTPKCHKRVEYGPF